MKLEVTTVEAYRALNPAKGFISRYDYTLNPYSGCSFGCSYCYAQYFATTEQVWGSWVKLKSYLGRAIEADMQRDGKQRPSIYISTATDPYQGLEKRYELTRKCLGLLLQYQARVTIQTRSPLVTRDIDVFRKYGNDIRVNLTINTDDDGMRARYEPSAPAIKARLKAAEALRDASIPLGISISPMLPLANVEAFAEQLKAFQASEYMTLYLKPEARAQMAAASSKEVREKLLADGLTEGLYQQYRKVLQSCLPLPLKEERQGFSPPGEE